MEKFEDRLRRFAFGSEREFALTYIMMVRNDRLVEVEEAKKRGLTVLSFLGTHAVIQMVGENILGVRGIPGTELYLKSFVDLPQPDRQWSGIAAEVHRMRNVMAHQGFSVEMESIVI